MNEIANLCEKVGANIDEVKEGISHDSRLGNKFLNAGIGYGGSCFPKDVRELISLGNKVGSGVKILTEVDKINEAQKSVLVKKLLDIYNGDIRGKMIAIWGLAFKPGTDDIREAPSISIIRQLLASGVSVRVHDPQAIPNVRKVFRSGIAYYEDKMDAINGADALLIVTEWDEYKEADMEDVLGRLATPVVVDGRNIYSLGNMESFIYDSIGRKCVNDTCCSG